ncbi:MAG: peptidoglycan DD-metalloendopeptidase family protein [Thiohalocapsa sp.]
MATSRSARRGARAAALALAWLLAGCASDTPVPAPLILKGDQAMMPAPAPAVPHPNAAAARPGRRIVVRRGQSVRGLARAHHVSPAAIIAANRLAPPYKIEIGQKLLIPGGSEALAHIAAAPPAASPAHHQPEVVPLDAAAPPAKPPAQAAAESSSKATAEPASKSSSKSSSKSIAFPDAPSAAAADAASERPGAPAHAAHFAWPVRGHILAGYGVTAGGGHNDGINIAAPRGAAVEAVDGGVVAYAGNELRGYGNLVLVKHSNGWISAYAHCEELLVKRGDKVRRGQVIAKVGATGGVSEPQLHFELRRGQRPVDPREFLAPASADAAAPAHRG